MGFSARGLPLLGVGISSSLGIARPDFRALRRARPDLLGFVELAIGWRAHTYLPEQLRDDVEAGTRFVVHPTELSLDPGDPPTREMLAGLRSIVDALRSPWTPEDVGTWVWRGEHLGGGFLPTALTEASLEVAVRRASEIQDATGVCFLAENPPFAEVIGDLRLGTFFRQLCERAGAGMLLDIGHLLSYQLARPDDRALFDELPWERVIEVHLAGGAWIPTESGAVFWDEHAAEVPLEARALLEEIWPRLPNVRALCFECEMRPDFAILDELDALRVLCPFPAAS
jgi:uncharacterized protein (UPF0276 family)